MTWIKGNRYLNASEMENNALLVSEYLLKRGWTLNAIAGLLGNMDVESTINPGIWQSLNIGNYSGGFGLVQWTPATNFTTWAITKGYEIDDGYAQLKWIEEETINYGQWIQTSDYPITFIEFKTSNEEPQYLASAFLKNFERAGVENELERKVRSILWYSFISKNVTPSEPDTPITPSKKKRKKFNFILFNRQRRTML